MRHPSLRAGRSRPVERSCGLFLLRTAFTLLLLGLAKAGCADAPNADAYFAEPISGRRVTQYTAELPVGRDERRPFMIPKDCEDVVRSIEEGAAYKSNIIERRLWQKVETDCRYHNFLHLHPLQSVQDYVSDYDFMNARLSDLPVDPGCVHGGPNSNQEQCHSTEADAYGLLLHFPLVEPIDAAPEEALGDECAFRDGLFYGRMYLDAHGVRCDPSANRPSLRLIGVDYADINGDGFLDAVLRFVPLGPGAARSPLILPLTRTQPTGPFQIPAALHPLPPGMP
jgi:hypothetical protein